MKPAEAIERLLILSPYPVYHEIPSWELDKRQRRSSCFCYWGVDSPRSIDFIYMNKGPARSWMYVQTLAHEVGHALDFANVHPAQDCIGKAHTHQGHFRTELAAVSFEIMACKAMGMTRLNLVQHRLVRSRDYCNKYTRPVGCPTLVDVCTDAAQQHTNDMLLWPLPDHLKHLSK